MANKGTITANISPQDATNQEIIWESLDTSVATVEGNGLVATVTGVAEGQADVTAVTEDGGYEATCRVTVKKPEVPVESMSVTQEELELETSEEG